MTIQLASLWCHPIKSHSAEQRDSVDLMAGQSMPGDRIWAIAHSAAKPDALRGEWAHCANFQRAGRNQRMLAITSRTDLQARQVTLSHPDLDDVTAKPDTMEGADAILAWVRPLVPEDHPQPVAVVSARARGMTDSDFPSISLMSRSSLRALGQHMGMVLTERRFRGNLWFEGEAPFAEYDWIGREARLGSAILRIVEPIQRCKATTANPDTGRNDTDTLAALRAGWGHQNFGVCAEVIGAGSIRVGDRLELM